MCDFVDMDHPQAADLPYLPDGSALIERSTDYALNIEYVLAFLASGDGGKEAERVLGFLGLPNATTMEKRSFPIIESRLTPVIKTLNEEILRENLVASVRQYYGNRQYNDRSLFDQWLENADIPIEQWPLLTCSADMGWQKRSSGRRYDSLSGHSFLVEASSRKPVAFTLRSKFCSICSRHNNDTGTPVRAHTCTINHEGSSGSMEPLAILDMVVSLYDKHRVLVKTIITDDDSSIKAKLKWSNDDWQLNNNTNSPPKIINRNGREVTRPNHGESPRYIAEPSFLADPNHRKKTLKGELYRTLGKRVDARHGLTKVDILRISTNFAYMMRTLPQQPRERWLDAARAVVEHHFDNHEFCGDFCNRKGLTDEQRSGSQKIYRCKQKDEKLYAYLNDAIARFITKEALDEVGHGHDTQVNESLNNTIAWYAPKNKTYSGTYSLTNRISIASGVHSIGAEQYYTCLLKKLGIKVTKEIAYYSEKQEQARSRHIETLKKKANKQVSKCKITRQVETMD